MWMQAWQHYEYWFNNLLNRFVFFINVISAILLIFYFSCNFLMRILYFWWAILLYYLVIDRQEKEFKCYLLYLTKKKMLSSVVWSALTERKWKTKIIISYYSRVLWVGKHMLMRFFFWSECVDEIKWRKTRFYEAKSPTLILLIFRD